MEQQRIDLTLQDVKHLETQFTREAAAKLDLYLPTTDLGDPLKNRVSSLVDDFIYDVFEAARDGMHIDGAKPDTLRSQLENPTNEVEPFDFSLQEQVRSLYQQVEEQTTRLTKLRREKPGVLKQAYKKKFELSISQIQALEKEIEAMQSDDEDLEEKEKVFKESMPKLEEVMKDYEASIHGIKELKERIPTERNELEKLNSIAKFLADN